MDAINTQLKKRIMRRIYIISFLKRIFDPIVLKSIILAIFVIIGNILVSVPNVVNNMPFITDIGALSDFIMNAFLHTETLVQIILLVSMILAAWLIRDMLRSFLFFDHNRQLVA